MSKRTKQIILNLIIAAVILGVYLFMFFFNDTTRYIFEKILIIIGSFKIGELAAELSKRLM